MNRRLFAQRPLRKRLSAGSRTGLSADHARRKFTAVFQKVPEGYIGFVEELPGANTQGDTLEEARESLSEAVELVLEAHRALAEESLVGKDVIREPLIMAAG